MTTPRFAFAVAAALCASIPSYAVDVTDQPLATADTSSPVRVTLPPASIVPPASDTPAAQSIPDSSAPASEGVPVIGRVPPAVADPVVEPLDAPPAPKYKDLWERIRAGFALKEIDSPLVARHEAWY